MAKIAHWKKGTYSGFTKLDPQKCYEELKTLPNASDNLQRIPNQCVVDFAKNNPQSELYNAFDWDDANCANAFRKHVAKNLKNSLYTFELENPQVKTVDCKEIKEIPLFINPGKKGESDHMPTEIVMSNKDLRQSTLEKALRELENFKKRYGFLKELEGIFSAIDNILNII